MLTLLRLKGFTSFRRTGVSSQKSFLDKKGANVDKAILDKNGKPRHRSGLKVGQKHSGQFKSGHDPRRNQHDAAVKEFRREFTAKLSEASEDVAQFLLDTMRDTGAPTCG
jgi:hypothetical protein